MTLQNSGKKVCCKGEHKNREVTGGVNRACTNVNKRDAVERDTRVEACREDNYLYKWLLLVRGKRIANISIRIEEKTERR